MNEYERGKYEEFYHRCWAAQFKKDKKDNPRLESDYVGAYSRGRFGVKKVPPPIVNPIPLTEKAQVVNRMMKRGFMIKEIAEMLGVPRQQISRIKLKYNLPM